MSEPLGFGRQIVNRTGRYNGLGRRDPDDEHRLLARYRAPVEMRLAERRRQPDDEGETEANEIERTGDVWLDQYLRHHRSGL